MRKTNLVFFSGLQDEVRLHVRILNPTTLNHAFGLAKIQEQYILSTRRSWRNGLTDFSQLGPWSSVLKYGKIGSILETPKTPPIAKMPYQKVFEAQMQDRRKKGLCYFCDEKWHQGRRCLEPKFFLLEGMELSDSTNGAIGLEQDKVADDEIE